MLFRSDLGYTDIPLEADLFADAQKGNVPLDSHPPQSLNKMVSKNNKSLIAVRQELGDCTRCKLSEDRKSVV